MTETLVAGPVLDFTASPSIQIRIGCEVSAVGIFDSTNGNDMKHMVSANNRKGLSDTGFDGEEFTLEDATDWATTPMTNKKGCREVVFAIRSQGVPSDEVGQVQGSVYFYLVPELVKDLRQRGYLSDTNRSTRIFEVSYTAKEGAQSHQVSSAVRQAIDQLLRLDMGKRKNESKHIVTPQIQIIASVDEVKNPASVHVLESVGFSKCGEAQYYREGVFPVYRLDWERYNQIMHSEKSVRSLLEFIARNGIKKERANPVSTP